MNMEPEQGWKLYEKCVEKELESMMYQKWLSDSQNYVAIATHSPKDSNLDPFPSWGEFWDSIFKPNKVPEHKRLLTEDEKQSILERIKKAQSKRGEMNGTV